MMTIIITMIITVIIIIIDISGAPFRTSPIGFQKAVIIIILFIILKKLGRGGILSKVRMYVLIQHIPTLSIILYTLIHSTVNRWTA